MTTLPNNDLIQRIENARQKFIYYYDRGVADKKWRRNNSMYMYWALQLAENSTELDKAVFSIWESVCKYRPGYDFETLEEVLKDFDLMVKFARLWAFS